MITYQLVLLTIFGIIAFLMIVDSNVAEYFILLFKILNINIQRFIWMIRFHPKNPITAYIMKRKMYKYAKELAKEQEAKKPLD